MAGSGSIRGRRAPRPGYLVIVIGVMAAMIGVVTPASAAIPPPAYYPSGPQTFVDESTVLGAGGWVECWSGLYADNGPALADLLAACDGPYLMMASGPIGSTTFDVLAAAWRTDVTFDTGGGDHYTTHIANGTAWYFNPSWSWGFAAAGDAVDKFSCDIAGPSETDRLCWHTGGGNLSGGYRSGATLGLNYSTDYRRVVLEPGVPLTVTVDNVNSATPAAGSVTSEPVGIDCPGPSCTGAWASGATVTLTAHEGPDTRFKGWSGACTGTSLTCQVTLATSAAAVTADFVTTKNLHVSVNGEQVLTNPGFEMGNLTGWTTSVGSGAVWVDTADPSPAGAHYAALTTGDGSSFTPGPPSVLSQELVLHNGQKISGYAKWYGGDGSFDAGSTAVVKVVGEDTVWTSSGAGPWQAWSWTAPEDGTYTLRVRAGNTFDDWVSSSMGFDVDVPKLPDFPDSGAVRDGTKHCSGVCDWAYDEGSMLALAADADAPNGFLGWGAINGGECTQTNASTCIITMNTDRAVEADFAALPLHVTVNQPPAGRGSVVSDVGTIDCPTRHCDDTFGWGTLVTLTAEAPTGTVFQGWSGDCSGMADTCEVTMGETHNVTADFGLPVYKPDATILAGGPTVGDGVYNGTGTGQTIKVPVGVRDSATITMSVHNDGTPYDDELALKGPRSDARAGIVYKVAGTNVTAEVVAGTYHTPFLAPGESFTMQVTVKGKAVGKKAILITATSCGGSSVDAVKAVVRVTD